MLSSHGLTVLIVDDDSKRATQTAGLIRVLGSVPIIATTEQVAARLLPDVDVVLAWAEAFNARGLRIAEAARGFRAYRCVATTDPLLGERRGLADTLVTGAFSATLLGDVLAAARKRRQGRPVQVEAHA